MAGLRQVGLRRLTLRRRGAGSLGPDLAYGPYQFFGKGDGTTSGYRQSTVYFAAHNGGNTRPSGGTTMIANAFQMWPAFIPMNGQSSVVMLKEMGMERGSGSSGNFKFVAYRNKGNGDYYPGIKIWESANITGLSTFNLSTWRTISQLIPSGSLIWLGYWSDSTTPSIKCLHSDAMVGYGGMRRDQIDNTSGDADYAFNVGWSIPQAYSSSDDAAPATMSTGVSETPLKTHNAAGAISTHPMIAYAIEIP
jgi:hypothetical protein